jgi:hypothetical protein
VHQVEEEREAAEEAEWEMQTQREVCPPEALAVSRNAYLAVTISLLLGSVGGARSLTRVNASCLAA